MIDGLCLEHYIEPLLPHVATFRPHTYVDLIVRFLGYTDRSGGPAACWLWTSNIHPVTGYGNIFVNNGQPRLQKAHRWAREHFIGPIPEGREVGHACCTETCPTRGNGDPHRRCVNPRHLVLTEEPKRHDYICTRCGRLHGKERPIKGGTAFCSAECRSGGRMVIKLCSVCGKEFTVPWSNDDRYQTCSWACKNVDTVYINCERCDRRFAPAKNNAVRYCSEACRRPPLMVACQNCGKEFRNRGVRKARRFCSVSCVRQFMGETELEARVRLALEALGIGFTQEYPFRRWSIDFAIPKYKVAIEADGDYWHALMADRDARRDRDLNDKGWTVVRLTESDVGNARDVGQFILTRVYEATGLGLAELIGPAVRGNRRARPVFRQAGRNVGRLATGQMPLWNLGGRDSTSA